MTFFKRKNKEWRDKEGMGLIGTLGGEGEQIS